MKLDSANIYQDIKGKENNFNHTKNEAACFPISSLLLISRFSMDVHRSIFCVNVIFCHGLLPDLLSATAFTRLS